MASVPKGKGSGGISAGTLKSGTTGSKPSTQSQKRNARARRTIPSSSVGSGTVSMQGYQPRTGTRYVGRLRSAGTVSAP
jgi:hypothetical protein